MKIPFGIAQIGKAFRNEIIARQFIFRMREFEQMEMQFFVKPGTQKEWYEKWKKNRMEWHLSIGINKNNYRFHNHDKLAHYADAACDIEFNFPFGFKELEGIHSRTDFDLANHEKFSSKQIKYFDHEDESKYTPYVVETSVGLDRLFLSILCGSFVEEEVKNEQRVVLKLPRYLAPISVAVLPLLKKDGLNDRARNIFNDLKSKFSCHYEEKDSIGKRYRRQDAIGTPCCITIDHQTLKDNTVTLRDRDTMSQERISVEKIHTYISEKVDIARYLL